MPTLMRWHAHQLVWAVLVLALLRPMATDAAPSTPTPTATPAPLTGSSASPVRCKAGIALVRLRNLDIAGDTFDAEFWIWSVCPTDQVMPLTTVDFINSTRTSVSLESRVTENGQVWDSAKVVGTFNHHWDLTKFPFDRQVLRIQLEDSANVASAFAYEPDRAGSIYQPDVAPAGWRVADFQLTEDVDTLHTTYGDPNQPVGTSDYSRLTLSVTLARTDYTSFIKLTFVVYIAFLISLISFFLNLNNPALLTARLSVISGALFAVAVNLRTATSTLSSDEGLTMIDVIHVAALVAILVDALAALITQLLVDRGHPAKNIIRFDRLVMSMVVIGFITANVLVIGWAANSW
jgi:hypothetical protein